MTPTVVRQPIRYDVDGAFHCRRRRWLYNTFVVVVFAFVVSAVVEVVTGLPLYGVDTETVRASAGDTDLVVTYPRLTRGQLDSPLRVIVHRRGGFDSPVTVEVTARFLDLFTENGISPQPSSETTHGDSVSMMFDPPLGDTLSIVLDLAARPRAGFDGAAGTVSVADESHQVLVSAGVHTDVRP